ncbi:UPF0481 protein At3g47200-like isoform X2 [Panicum virgatum]|uniref:Uncharacterized protein n=1 Tax=Panicum virgatum TaxID=38727 RepID=A0A8T0PN01_PANVG|nr:UPF0481 protein At3g47200-like isoform X2 [Panicum virgatum]KAG2562475.1 hypothetical protein PVAP13_8KG294800 [Panicum virgatum]
MDKMLVHSELVWRGSSPSKSDAWARCKAALRGGEMLRGEGAVSSGSVVETQEAENMAKQGANEELMDVSEEKGNCSSWVVEMEKLLEDSRPSVEMARWKQRSIYRVPEFMKKMTNRDAFQPLFVSLGPLHHGEPHLLPMEEHKRRAVLHMVNWTGKHLTEYVAAMEEVADELEAAYDDLDDRWRGVNRGSFVQMMVMDGCFLIELIKIDQSPEFKNTNYADNDPVFSRSSFLNLWSIMKNDMIAMENQIPLVVLQRILFVACNGTPPRAGEINRDEVSLWHQLPPKIAGA